MTDYQLFKEDLLGSPGVHFWVKDKKLGLTANIRR